MCVDGVARTAASSNDVAAEAACDAATDAHGQRMHVYVSEGSADAAALPRAAVVTVND